MGNDELKRYIVECNQNLSPSLPASYEVSFFKIYVKFEVYLAKIFEEYSVGNSSSLGYCPQRKLAFIDKEHLRAVLKGDKQYVDYIKKIESLSRHIFVDNPFNLIFEVEENLNLMNQMIALRNYIAHESGEARKRYVETCLGGGKFIEPATFLCRKNKRKSVSNYTIYVEKIKELSELILDKPLV